MGASTSQNQKPKQGNKAGKIKMETKENMTYRPKKVTTKESPMTYGAKKLANQGINKANQEANVGSEAQPANLCESTVNNNKITEEEQGYTVVKIPHPNPTMRKEKATEGAGNEDRSELECPTSGKPPDLLKGFKLKSKWKFQAGCSNGDQEASIYSNICNKEWEMRTMADNPPEPGIERDPEKGDFTSPMDER